MKITMLLVVGAALGWSPDEDPVQAIAIVEKARGKVTIDREQSGQPVVGVDL